MAADETTNAVFVRGLVKRYGDVVAVDGVDLSVPHGSFFGLLGPNGAGKTTTVGVVTTLVRPSAGDVRLLGRDVVRERSAARPLIGIVFQEPSLDPQLTGREHLDLHARLYRLSDRRRRVGDALAWIGLEEAADRPVRQYSGGMRRRLEIARGLLHEPKVLFLDEPTVGLDVTSRAAVWERLRALHGAGDTTLFLTTHSMEEADALCERLAILDRGRVVAEGSPRSLKAGLGGDVALLTVGRGAGAEPALAELPGVRAVRAEPLPSGETRLRVTTEDGPRRLPALVEAAAPFELLEVELHRPSLEHVFLHHTGHAFEASAAAGQGEGAA